MRRIQTDDSGDRQTGEGCLEIAITCNWQCMACIFGANDEGLFLFWLMLGTSYVQALLTKACVLFRLSDVMLACLLEDIAQASA